MFRLWMLAIVLVAGAGIPVQVAVNHRLKDAVHSAALAATLSFSLGAVALGLLTLSGALGRGSLASLGSAPWWAWVGGLLSAFAVVAQIIALPRFGAELVITTIVVGQMIMAVSLDHFGVLGVARVPMNAWRAGGALLVIAGALLMQKK